MWCLWTRVYKWIFIHFGITKYHCCLSISDYSHWRVYWSAKSEICCGCLSIVRLSFGIIFICIDSSVTSKCISNNKVNFAAKFLKTFCVLMAVYCFFLTWIFPPGLTPLSRLWNTKNHYAHPMLWKSWASILEILHLYKFLICFPFTLEI